MTQLINKNETLNKIGAVLVKAKDDRATIINEVIDVIIAEAKNHTEHFTTKRKAQKFVIEYMLEGMNRDDVNTYTKRALYVAKAILVDGYTIKKESLTLAQAENAVKCEKSRVNKAMKTTDEDDYIATIKALIKLREIDSAMKTIATLGGTDMLDAIKSTFGDDAKKLVNAMQKVL